MFSNRMRFEEEDNLTYSPLDYRFHKHIHPRVRSLGTLSFPAILLLFTSSVAVSGKENPQPSASEHVSNPGAGADRPHIVFVIAEEEYRTAEFLPDSAEKDLAGQIGWQCSFRFARDRHNIPGLEVSEETDLLFLSVRRRALPDNQLEIIRNYCEAGKPLRSERD